jgi:hypothetical protein
MSRNDLSNLPGGGERIKKNEDGRSSAAEGYTQYASLALQLF